LFITPPPLLQLYKNIVAVQKQNKKNPADYNVIISNTLKASDLFKSRETSESITKNNTSIIFSSLSIITPVSFVIATQYPFIINNETFKSNSIATPPVILKNGIFFNNTIMIINSF
jgi:hypothetical protein